jgi:hypothetical protein
MTLVKKLREVFLDEPVLKKNLFQFVEINHHMLKSELEVNCKNNQLQGNFAANLQFCSK